METKELKNRIDNSPYFSLDPVSQGVRRETEKNRLIKLLAEFSIPYIQRRCGKKSDEACEFGVEIMNTILGCLQAFDNEKGQSFFAYYLRALENNRKSWEEQARIDAFSHGLGFDKKKLSRVYYLVKEEESRQKGDVGSPAFIVKVAEEIGISKKETCKYIDIVKRKVLEMNAEMNSEEEDGFAEYGDTIADPAAENAFLKLEGNGCEILFGMIQKSFDSLQQRQKKLIAMLITTRLFEHEELWSELQKYEFFDEEVFMICTERNECLTDREIAEMTGQFESAVSRSWNTFWKRLNMRRAV